MIEHKALSVRAPWAHLISTGRKRLELRSQRTHYRGPLLICASRKASNYGCNVSCEEYDAAINAPRGVALCVVQVIDCRPATAEDARDACCEPEPGDWAWVLSDPVPVEQVPVSGKLGFFKITI